MGDNGDQLDYIHFNVLIALPVESTGVNRWVSQVPALNMLSWLSNGVNGI